MGDDLQLEGEDPEISDRAKARRITSENYKQRIAFYCDQFRGDKSDPLDRKTVERWIAKGRALQDLPPLDEPARMASWWRSNFKRRVPEVFLTFETEGGEGAPRDETKPDAAAGVTTETDKALWAAMNEAQGIADRAGSGFAAALERAHAAERSAWALWQAAVLKPELFTIAQIDKRKKNWEDSLDVMRKAEMVAEKILQRSDEWATWEEVERILGPYLSAIEAGVRGIFTRVATLETLPPGEYERLEPVYQNQVDEVFSELSAGGFAPLLELVA
jgi:hypothetical protein